MKTKNRFQQLIVVLFLVMSMFAHAQPPNEPDPNRGMYVSGFIKQDPINTNLIFEEFSILGVDQDRNGVFEKEDELLKYAMENHITYLVFYDMDKVLNPGLFAYDVNEGTLLGMDEHFCRFVTKARNDYCITQIGVTVGGTGRVDDVIDYNEIFSQPTPAFMFTAEEIASPSFDPNLLFVQNNYIPTDPEYISAEATKFYLRASHFKGCYDCDAHIDVMNLEGEYWNSPTCAKWLQWWNILIYMQSAVASWNIPGHHPMMTEIYHHHFPVLNGLCAIYSPSAQAGNIDGSDPNYYNSIRLADRVCPAYYYGNTPDLANPDAMYPGGIADILNYFSMAISNPGETFPQTDYHPLFSAERIGDEGGYDNYTGLFVNSKPEYNIFRVERNFYDNWRLFQGGSFNANYIVDNRLFFGDIYENNVQPGGALWYSSRQMIHDLNGQAIFTSHSPTCTQGATGVVKFDYCGPLEPGIGYEFWVTQGFNTVYSQNGTSGDYKPDTPHFPGLNLSIDMPNFPTCLLNVGDYIAHMKLTFNNDAGCSYQYDLPISIGNSAIIVATGPTTFCQGQNVYLKAMEDLQAIPTTTYQWYQDGSLITGATNLDYNVTETGNYSCDIIGLPGCAGLSNTIHIKVHPNPPAIIGVECRPNNKYGLFANPNSFGGTNPQSYNWAGLTYLWETGETTDEIEVQTTSVKNYWLQTTSPDGCINTAKSRVATTPISLVLGVTTNIASDNDCHTENTRLQCNLTPNNLAAYLWSTGETTQAIQYLLPGTYSVMANNGLRGCMTVQSYTVQNTFVPNISVNITPASCFGGDDGAIYITNTGNYDLQWQFVGEDNIDANGDVTDLQAGFYQLTVLEPTGCGAATYVYEITQPPPIEFTLTPSPATVNCHGDMFTSVTFIQTGGSPAVFYDWSNGANTANLGTVAAGSYQLTVTDGSGCTSSEFVDLSAPHEIEIETEIEQYACAGQNNGIIHVHICGGTAPYTVLPATWIYNAASDEFETTTASTGNNPISVTDINGCSFNDVIFMDAMSIQGQVTNVVCPGQTTGAVDIIVSNANGTNLTYLWTPGNFTTQNLVGVTDGTYTVVVTDENGCTALETFIVDYDQQGYCRGNDETFCTPIFIPSGGNLIAPGEHIGVNANITIDGNYTFDQNTLLIKGGVQITVLNGVTLTITNSMLRACIDMWGGILVLPGGALIIENGTTVMDALIAADGQSGSSITIQNSTLDQNYIGVNLQNGNFANCVFEESNFICSTPLLTRTPHGNHRPKAQFNFNEVGGVIVGVNSGTPNNIANAEFGIAAVNSNVYVINNNFSNDRSIGASTAIDSKIAGGAILNYILSVGDGTSQGRNTFVGWSKGIVTNDVDESLINSNTFDDCLSGIEINKPTHAAALNNDIDNFELGIGVYDGYFISHPCQICPFEILVEGNNLNKNPIFIRSGKIGIEALQRNREDMRTQITDNEVWDCRYGIHCENVSIISIGSVGLTTTVLPNTVEFILGTTPNSGIPYSGIWLKNCRSPRVTGNLIHNNLAAVTGTTNFVGINIEACYAGRINCNTITNIPIGMKYFGDCGATLLRENNFNAYEQGVFVNGATLPAQYQINNTTGDKEPLDNKWNDPPATTVQTDRVTGLSPTLILWFVRVPTATYDPLEGGTTSTFVVPQYDFPGTVDCNDFSDFRGREAKFGAAVGDSLQFEEYDSENAYFVKSNAYKAMKEDNSIINQGNANDNSYQLFYDEMNQSNIGIFDSINELSGDSTAISSAISINNSVNDSNSIEYYKKLINDIYLNTLQSNVPLSSSDSMICDNVSELSYYITGDAKYYAAAMIRKLVHPVYVPMRKAQLIEGEKEENKYILYPNPTSNSFKLYGEQELLSEVSLMNSEGKLLKRFLNPLPLDFEITELSNGFYKVRLVDLAGNISYLRLIIIK